MNPDDVLGLLGLGVLTHGGYLFARLRSRRPRLCACDHGSGMHGIDGCKGYVRTVDKKPVYCGCSAYDGMGRRIR